jgi:hypothetical protein
MLANVVGRLSACSTALTFSDDLDAGFSSFSPLECEDLNSGSFIL